MVVVRAERENSWALAFQLYFPIALYRQRIDLSSAFFDNDSISHLELLVRRRLVNGGSWSVSGHSKLLIRQLKFGLEIRSENFA